MAAPVLDHVLGSSRLLASDPISSQKAELKGYIRRQVKGCDYPAIIQASDPSARVEGLYVSGLTSVALTRLDEFEGGEYQRVSVEIDIVDSNGSTIETTSALAYVWAGREDQLLQGDWDFMEFQRLRMALWTS